jgi:cytochrome c553
LAPWVLADGPGFSDPIQFTEEMEIVMQPMHMSFFAAAVLGLVVGLTPAQAQSGRDKAKACAICHGQLGLSTLPNAPHLAGQPEIYLIEQLKAYRSGKRANEVMAVIAKPLSDADIADLASWYASLQIEVKERP